jgi:hypothetical protein
MTDEELLTWVTRSEKDTCGRFNNDQLQRDIIIYPEKKFSFRYLWQFMVASLLIAGKGEAQTGKPVFIKTEIKKPSSSNEKHLMGDVAIVLKKGFKISGTIIDSSNNNPIPFASIRIKGTARGVQADSVGKFVFEYVDTQYESELEFSSIGYGSKTIVVNQQSATADMNISLAPFSELLGEVSVNGYATQGKLSLTGLVGGYSVVCVKNSPLKKLRNYLDELLPSKKAIVVYPNPTSPGSSINLALDLKETGQYKLELTDASGKLLLSKSITVSSVKKQEAITTNAAWSSGVYYLRISQPGKKFDKTTKVLLQ